MSPLAPQPRAHVRRAGGFWRQPLWAPLNDAEAWNRLVRIVNPAWSFTEPRARVVRVVDEAPGVRSLWLKPNGRFGHFSPGQHVLLELEIDGVRQARCFSLSHAPRADRLLRLTIKRKDDGPVSRAAHALARGQVVRLGRAQGQFAPRDPAAPLLLLAAGSGITPMLSLLHGMVAAGADRDVVLLHGIRAEADAIGTLELQQLAARWPRLRVHVRASASQGRLDPAAIAGLVPDWRGRETLLCGPDGFMRQVEAMYAAAGCSALLQSESFGRRAAPIVPGAAAHAVSHGSPEQVFTALAGQSLLEAAEAAGLRPRYGCRRGICRTCTCRKRSGTVTNLLTGLASGPGEELIQLCVSSPQSALELAL